MALQLGSKLCIFALIAITVSAAPNTITNNNGLSTEVCTSDACKRAAKRISENMDATIDPCDNFYKFACGGFIESTKIPGDRPFIAPYTQINEILYERLRKLFEANSTSDELKPFSSVKRFYKACLDTTSIEANSVESLTLLLNQVGGWPVLKGETWNEADFDWKNITYELRNLGMFHAGFIYFGTDSHPKNSSRRLLTVAQADLGLHQEVLSQGFNSSLVSAYYKYMINVAVTLGADQEDAEREMLDAVNLEIDLAKISVPADKVRNMNLLYNPMSLDEMQKKYGFIPWVEFVNNLLAIDSITVDGSEIMNVQQPRFVAALETLLQNLPKRVQANYAIWRAIKAVTPYLSERILQHGFEADKERTGVVNRRQRWDECVVQTKARLPLLVGAMYARNYFSPEAREKVEEIVKGLKEVFTQILKDVDWMGDLTRQHGLEKVQSMITYVGYSDQLFDDKIIEEHFSQLELNSNNFLQLGLNATLFKLRKKYETLREPAVRSDWRTRSTPAIINAFYSLGDNSIEIPAAILQDIYFEENNPRYVNYGGVGFLAGHEITHGFDDQGRQFDKNGDLIDWWDKNTTESFVKKTQCIVDQYSNYTVPEVGLQVNGVITQSENIADNGGAKEAYIAYQNWVKQNSPEALLPGLNYTANQLFWLSLANPWCSNFRPEYTKVLLLTNAHCTDEFRVTGVVQNMVNFSKDFNCPLGSPMNPAKKCMVW